MSFCVVMGLLSRSQRAPARGGGGRVLAPWVLGGVGMLAALALVPGRHTVDGALARLQAGMDQGPEAVRTAALPEFERHPAAAVLYALMASAYSQAQPPRLGETLAFVNRALYLRPLDATSHQVAARVLLGAGRRNQALLEYRLAYEASPDRKDELQNEALRSARGLDELVRVLPEDVETRAEALRKLLDAGRKEEAGALAAWALEQTPPDATSLPLLLHAAKASAERQDVEGALLHLAEAERRAPKRPEPLVARARLLASQARHAEAMDMLEQGVDRFPGEVELLLTLSSEQLALGLPAGARKTLERASAFMSGPAARSRLFALEAETFRAQGFLARALEGYRSASRVSPKVSDYHFEAAKLLETMGRPSEALGALREGLRERNGEPDEHLRDWVRRLEQSLKRTEENSAVEQR